MLHLNEYSVFDNIPEKVEFDDIILNEIHAAMRFVQYIKNDQQLEKGGEDYMGFVNVSTDFMRDEQMQQNFQLFLKHIDVMEKILDKLGLEVEPHPDEDETIIQYK